MTKCIILGAGASYGYDDALNGLQKPPKISQFFTKGNALGLFTSSDYPRAYDKLQHYIKMKFGASEKGVTREIDVEKFLEWMAKRFEKLSSLNRLGSSGQRGYTQRNNKLGDFQAALGEMWYFSWDLLRHYSSSYSPNFDNYQRLALHHRLEHYTVITLNYDTIFESAILQVAGSFNYAPPNPPGSIPIARVHGSVSWFNPAGRAIAMSNVPRNQVLQNVASFIYSNRFNMERPVILDPRMLDRLRVQDLLRSGTDYDEPILIPPLGNHKDYEKVNLYKEVWGFADRMLSDASELVLIGTTLRKEDVRLCDAIQRNVKQATEVVAVGDKRKISRRLSKILPWKVKLTHSYSNFGDYARTL